MNGWTRNLKLKTIRISGTSGVFICAMVTSYCIGDIFRVNTASAKHGLEAFPEGLVAGRVDERVDARVQEHHNSRDMVERSQSPSTVQG